MDGYDCEEYDVRGRMNLNVIAYIGPRISLRNRADRVNPKMVVKLRANPLHMQGHGWFDSVWSYGWVAAEFQ